MVVSITTRGCFDPRQIIIESSPELDTTAAQQSGALQPAITDAEFIDLMSREIAREPFAPDRFFNAVLAKPVERMSLYVQYLTVLDFYFSFLQSGQSIDNSFSIYLFTKYHVPQAYRKEFIERIAWQAVSDDEWNFSYLMRDFRNALYGISWQTLAETLPEVLLRQEIQKLSKTDRLKLVHVCYGHYREGAFFLLKELEASARGQELFLLKNLRSSYFNRESFDRFVTKNRPLSEIIEKLTELAEKENRALLHEIDDLTIGINDVRKFCQFFGHHQYIAKVKDKQKSVYLDELPEDQCEKQRSSILVEGFWRHHKALKARGMYEEGLGLITWALPTTGKDLTKLAWIPSMVRGLVAGLEHLQADGSNVAISSFPIFVFDQSNEPLFSRNRAYIEKLERASGVIILHLSRDQVEKIAEKIGVLKLLSGKLGASWGYAGSRNAVYLIAPVLRELVRKNLRTFEEWIRVPAAELKMYFDEFVLGDKSIVYMGDDDTEFPSSNVLELALLALEQKENNFLVSGITVGRSNASKYPQQAFTSDVESLATHDFGMHWSDELQGQGMNGVFSKPRFNLSLPYPALEATGTCLLKAIDTTLLHPLIHLAGSRAPMGALPTKPYIGYQAKMRALTIHNHRACQSAELYKFLPWAQIRKFSTFRETFEYVASSETKKKLQLLFWDRFCHNWQMVAENKEIGTEEMPLIIAEEFQGPIRTTLPETYEPSRQTEVAEYEGFKSEYQTCKGEFQTANDFVKSVARAIFAKSGNYRYTQSTPDSFRECLIELFNKNVNFSELVKQAKRDFCRERHLKMGNAPLTEVHYRLMRSLGAGEFCDDVAAVLGLVRSRD